MEEFAGSPKLANLIWSKWIRFDFSHLEVPEARFDGVEIDKVPGLRPEKGNHLSLKSKISTMYCFLIFMLLWCDFWGLCGTSFVIRCDLKLHCCCQLE